MLFVVTIRVMRKAGIFDPEALQVQKTLATIGFPTVSSIVMGKIIEIWLDAATEEEARVLCDKMGRDLLANPNIEKHEIVSALPG